MVLPKRFPAYVGVSAVQAQPVVGEAAGLVDQRRAIAKSTITGELQGATLGHLAQGRRVQQKGEIAMGMQVDEPRRHHKPRGVYRFCGGFWQLANCCYPAIQHADVGLEAGSAGAVIDIAVLD